MQVFKDTAGRDWSIEIDVPARRAVLQATAADVYPDGPVDLFQLDGSTQVQLADPGTLVDVLFVLCKSQAEEKSVNATAFAKSFTGDALEAASEALMGAIIDFFPSRQRTLMLKALAKSKAESELAYAKVNNELDTDQGPQSSEKSSDLPDSSAPIQGEA